MIDSRELGIEEALTHLSELADQAFEDLELARRRRVGIRRAEIREAALRQAFDVVAALSRTSRPAGYVLSVLGTDGNRRRFLAAGLPGHPSFRVVKPLPPE